MTAHGYLYLVLLLALALLGYLVVSGGLASRPALPLRRTGLRAAPRPVRPHRVVPAIPPGRTGEFGIIRRQPFSYSGKRLACGRCSV